MTRSGTTRRLTAALLGLGLFATLSFAQPQRPPLDPLAEAKARQAVADQKAEIEVTEAVRNADRLVKNNPVKAVQGLRAAQINIDLAAGISGTARRNLTDLIQARSLASKAGL